LNGPTIAGDDIQFKFEVEGIDNDNVRIVWFEHFARFHKSQDGDPSYQDLLNNAIAGLENDDQIEEAETELRGILDAFDPIFSVYDHKSLWRANLYIVEGDEEVDASEPLNPSITYEDWNNNHPWIEGNEWNKIYDGSERLSTNAEVDEDDYLPELDDGNGGQTVKIHPFTYIFQITAMEEKDAVAYDYGSNDSPFEFNDEMLQQQMLLAERFDAAGIEEGQPGHDSNTAWSSTRAPKSRSEKYDTYYGQYIYPSELELPEGLSEEDRMPDIGTNRAAQGKLLGQKEPSVYTKSITIDDREFETFPFLPGYALYRYWKTNKIVPKDWENAIGSGLDCVGLVQRAISWHGNPYNYGSPTRRDGTNTNGGEIEGHSIWEWRYNEDEAWFINDRTHAASNPNDQISVRIEASDDMEPLFDLFGNPVLDEVGNQETYYAELSLVRPGDILLVGPIGNPGHSVMVQSVEDSNGDGIISKSEVKLIEATWSPSLKWAKVVSADTDGFTLERYGTGTWEIVRLRSR
jgi:hypothetical protein